MGLGELNLCKVLHWICVQYVGQKVNPIKLSDADLKSALDSCLSSCLDILSISKYNFNVACNIHDS